MPSDSEYGLSTRAEQGKSSQVAERPNISLTEHEGLLPDPETMAGYENAMSGLADRITRMAEAEQQHRHQIEREK